MRIARSFRRWPFGLLFLLLTVGSTSATLQQQPKGGEEETGPYDVVDEWPILARGY